MISWIMCGQVNMRVISVNVVITILSSTSQGSCDLQYGKEGVSSPGGPACIAHARDRLGQDNVNINNMSDGCLLL